MIFREVLHFTEQEVNGAYYFDKIKGIGPRLGSSLGKSIEEQFSYSDRRKEGGGWIFSLEVIAFSPAQWEAFIKAISPYIPGEDSPQVFSHLHLNDNGL